MVLKKDIIAAELFALSEDFNALESRPAKAKVEQLVKELGEVLRQAQELADDLN